MFPTFDAWRSAVRHSYAHKVIDKAKSPDEIEPYMAELNKALGLTEERFNAFRDANIKYVDDAAEARAKLEDAYQKMRGTYHGDLKADERKEFSSIYGEVLCAFRKANRALDRAFDPADGGIDPNVGRPWWQRFR